MYTMKIKNLLWTVPFVSFFFGYMITKWILTPKKIATPHLVGKQVHEILPLITPYNLNLRLVHQKEDSILPAGIIIKQTPATGTQIKPHQPIFIITTKKPVTKKAPSCLGLHHDAIIPQLEKADIIVRIHYITHIYPKNHCFAQSPEPGKALTNNRITLYLSSGSNKPIVWPHFIGLPIEQVITFLDTFAITPTVFYDTLDKDNAIVTDQRPVAGTVLTIEPDKPFLVQLRAD